MEQVTGCVYLHWDWLGVPMSLAMIAFLAFVVLTERGIRRAITKLT